MSQSPGSESHGVAIALLLFGVTGGLGLDLAAKALLTKKGVDYEEIDVTLTRPSAPR